MDTKPTNVKCPQCLGPMKRRTNSNTGQSFLGCEQYPRCGGTRNADGLSPSEAREARSKRLQGTSADRDRHRGARETSRPVRALFDDTEDDREYE